jgi:hypothetical protein
MQQVFVIAKVFHLGEDLQLKLVDFFKRNDWQ